MKTRNIIITCMILFFIAAVGCKRNKKEKNPKDYTKYISGYRKWHYISFDSLYGSQSDTTSFEIQALNDSMVYWGIAPGNYKGVMLYRSIDRDTKYTYFNNGNDSTYLLELKYYYETDKIIFTIYKRTPRTFSTTICFSL